MDYSQLKKKYNIDFDVIVVDCEGAFYYILQDFPEILDGIKTIIMENDYNDINHYNYVSNILKQNDFLNIYTENGGWGPCYSCFFQTWKKQ